MQTPEPPAPRRLNPDKLHLSKWTAAVPRNKEKHFIVTGVIRPADPDQPVELVTLEAVLTRRVQTIRWRELTDPGVWLQGWC